MRFIAQIDWIPSAVQKVAAHGLTTADVAEAIDTAYGEARSRTSGRPIRFGHSLDGREICVVFIWTGHDTIQVVTAFPVDD